MDNMITDHMIEEAEKWFATFAKDKGSYRQRADFTRWYEQSPAHQKAYAQVACMQDLGIDFTDISSPTPHNDHIHSSGHVEASFSMGKSLSDFFCGPKIRYAAAVAVMVMAAFLVSPYLFTPELKIYATETGGTQLVTLPDGSEIRLGADTGIKVSRFSEDQRLVYLDHGEALFTVQEDKNRPFIVVSDETRIQVLGTIFNMNKAEKDLKVSLLEGRVKVIQGQSGGASPFGEVQNVIELVPAHSVTVSSGIIQDVKLQDIKNMAAWVDGQLTYTNATLGEVVADLRRYTKKNLSITHRDIESLPITATFRIEQVDNIIESLPSILPIKLTKTSSGDYVFRKK